MERHGVDLENMSFCKFLQRADTTEDDILDEILRNHAPPSFIVPKNTSEKRQQYQHQDDDDKEDEKQPCMKRQRLSWGNEASTDAVFSF